MKNCAKGVRDAFTPKTIPFGARSGKARLIVPVIFTLLLSLFSVPACRPRETAEVATRIRVNTDIRGLKTNLTTYQALNGFYPTTEQGLRALAIKAETEPVPTRWYMLVEQVPRDPWQHDYVYRSPGLKNPQGFDLFSAGSDGVSDTTDDDWGE